MKLDRKILELWQAAKICGKDIGGGDSKCGTDGFYCEHHLKAKEAAEEIQLLLNKDKDSPGLLHSGGRLGKKK